MLADPAKTGDTPNLTSTEPEQVAALARQYKTGLILLGQVHGNNGDWVLLSGGPQQRWNNDGANAAALLTDAGNGLADRLAKQLNVIGSANIDGKLWISGINSAMDYANLLATLRADPAVRQVTTMSAQGDGMLFAVKASLPMDALSNSLAAGGRSVAWRLAQRGRCQFALGALSQSRRRISPCGVALAMPAGMGQTA